MLIKAGQYDALVKLMRGSRESAANRAARRVLVDGLTQAEAMRETGATRSTVSDAVTRYWDAYLEICREFSNAVPALAKGTLIGYLVHPSQSPERIVMRVDELPEPGKRAKGTILATSNPDKDLVGRVGHFFAEDIECCLSPDQVESWVSLIVPDSAPLLIG